jgi:hypothetical protein
MPEQISKYPDVTLQILRESGAVCGQGAPQKILKQCPRDRFCSLQTGEICIFGLNDISKMTQITSQDLAQSCVRKLKRPPSYPRAFQGSKQLLFSPCFLRVSLRASSGRGSAEAFLDGQPTPS